MIVPRYWAECRLQEKSERRQRTVRRFGWSQESQADAQAMADQRAREAMERVRNNDATPRSEPKVPYHGLEGTPIREEILQEHGETVITRNSYGAWCLNTPNILFADMDDAALDGGVTPYCVLPVLGIVSAIVVGILFKSFLFGAMVFALGVLIPPFSIGLRRLHVRMQGGPRVVQLKRINRWIDKHPNWRLRVYETPAGVRLLATHGTFDPVAMETIDFFRTIGADPIYIAMCANQRCFRARLTAKPWRIGIAAHMKPRPGVWPVAPEKLPTRNAWIREYEAKAKDFASCRFLQELGNGTVDPEADAVRRLHDNLSQACTELPIA